MMIIHEAEKLQHQSAPKNHHKNPSLKIPLLACYHTCIGFYNPFRRFNFYTHLEDTIVFIYNDHRSVVVTAVSD